MSATKFRRRRSNWHIATSCESVAKATQESKEHGFKWFCWFSEIFQHICDTNSKLWGIRHRCVTAIRWRCLDALLRFCAASVKGKDLRNETSVFIDKSRNVHIGNQTPSESSGSSVFRPESACKLHIPVIHVMWNMGWHCTFPNVAEAQRNRHEDHKQISKRKKNETPGKSP